MSVGWQILCVLWGIVSFLGSCIGGSYYIFEKKDLKRGLLCIGCFVALPLTLVGAVLFTILFTLSVIVLELPTMYLVARKKFRAQLEAISEETD